MYLLIAVSELDVAVEECEVIKLLAALDPKTKERKKVGNAFMSPVETLESLPYHRTYAKELRSNDNLCPLAGEVCEVQRHVHRQDCRREAHLYRDLQQPPSGRNPFASPKGYSRKDTRSTSS
jgi:hypothetical protein